MMPGADFKACLETPHLAKDASTPVRVPGDVAQAQELLNAAADKMKDNWDAADVTLLCYRAMYSAAMALLHSAGYRCSNFRCLVVALDELFIRPKHIEQALVDRLMAAQAVTGDAAENFKAAEDFLAKAKELSA